MSIPPLFGAEGPLARAIDGYRPRPGQIAMAQAVADNHGLQVLEAGTGIGKTFAYLAPIIYNGWTAIISTGTRALQDQLFLRDIPFLTETLGRPAKVAMLKGRANYLCRRNLDNPAMAQLFNDERGDWERVLRFAVTSEEGDIRAASDIPPKSPVWQAAVSTRENCPAQKCKFYEDCFLYRARARARQADIVVVNHALFLSDMRLREEEIAELLPARDIVVFDEAHLLLPLAPKHFGETISIAEMMRIVADIEREASTSGVSEEIAALSRKWRVAAGNVLELSTNFNFNTAGRDAVTDKSWLGAMKTLQKTAVSISDAAVDYMHSLSAADAERFSGIAVRIASTAAKTSRWLELASGEPAPQAEDSAPDNEEEEEAPSVCWLEKKESRNNLILHVAPVSGRQIFRRAWQNCENVIMTSATLTVNNKFDDFVDETGTNDAFAQSWASPFDYAARAMLYLPPDMPDTRSPDYSTAVARIAEPLVRANGGRAFLLFSSLRALDESSALLAELLGNEYRILKQGDAPNDALLREFGDAKNTVLAGSLSFWQGVDVKGGALSLVIADKIPFTPPSDPLLSAKDEWRKRRGENPFKRNQLPPATILMKQVAGRLMRDFDDWGVFAACDPRLLTRPYGKSILSSLPPMRRSGNEKEACDFLRTMREKADS